MRIGFYKEKGDARDVLRVKTVHQPEPQAGEVLIRLHYSGINPSDVKMRAGLSLGGSNMPFPEICPHSDGAGEVVALGAGVDDFSLGERVYVFNAGFKRANGTAAEYITLPHQQVISLPDNASMQHGACLGIPAMTAAYAVTCNENIRGKNLLISSGGGVVGRYCIQIAKAIGVEKIIATASSAQSIKTAQEAGADNVLDYNDPQLATAIMDISGGIDHAVEAEFGANIGTLAQVINTNGSIATYGSALEKNPVLPFYDFMFKNITIHAMLVYVLPDEHRRTMARLIEILIDNGSITENIAATFSLDAIADAHEMVEESNKSGSVLLDLRS